jgi:hypothetical protein
MASESFGAPPLQRRNSIPKRKFEAVNGSPNASQNSSQNALQIAPENLPQNPLHAVASYNMSFASDLANDVEPHIGSEKHFISDSRKRAHALGLDHSPRSSWERAAQLVRHFWLHEKNSSVIGLQEMNTSTILDKPAELFRFPGGDRRIQEVLQGLGLEFYVKEVPGRFNTFPTLVTVWKSTKLGTKQHAYTADLGIHDLFKTNAANQGRPISIVYTTLGFMLINLHGPNDSTQSHTGNMEKLRTAINDHVKIFTDAHADIQINPDKLFVMGDFNDPFNAINRERPLIVQGHPVHYNTEEDGLKPVKSCCYNFNSACPDGDDHYNNTGQQQTHANGMVAGPYECYIRKSADRALNQDLGGTIKTNASNTLNGQNISELSVGARGHLANYKFTGDYVMGAKVVRSLQTYRPAGFRTEVSLESDHDMVMAIISTDELPVAPVALVEGGRTRRTRHKVRRTHKAKRAHHKQRRTRHKALRNRRTRRN